MKKLLIFCFVLSISTYVECISDYKFSSAANGWFKSYKIFANWTEASLQCFRDYAVLASPNSTDVLNEMLEIIRAPVNQRQSYFIGVHSTFSPGHFVSIDGIPLDNLPVTDMIRQLNLNDGECLSTDGYEIKVTSCATLLPYICYSEQEPRMKVITHCGTFDEDYKYEPSTDSCYKLHKDYRTWREAHSMCISEDGYLVILNDETEARLVYSMFPETKLNTNHTWPKKMDPLFIGLRNWGQGVWRSIHGEPIEHLYNDWQDDELSSHIDQVCGAIVRQGGLNKVDCNVLGFYVCEKNRM